MIRSPVEVLIGPGIVMSPLGLLNTDDIIVHLPNICLQLLKDASREPTCVPREGLDEVSLQQTCVPRTEAVSVSVRTKTLSANFFCTGYPPFGTHVHMHVYKPACHFW